MQRVIHIDLPSTESPRKPGVFDELRKALGNKAPSGSGRDRITLSTLAVIEGLAEGFRGAGIDDVVRFEVNGEVILNDDNDEQGDLPFIVTQALGAGLLDRPFDSMVLHVRDEVAGTTLDLTARVAAEVDKRKEELNIHCATAKDIDHRALEGRIAAIARSLAAEFGDARWRVSR